MVHYPPELIGQAFAESDTGMIGAESAELLVILLAFLDVAPHAVVVALAGNRHGIGCLRSGCIRRDILGNRSGFGGWLPGIDVPGIGDIVALDMEIVDDVLFHGK